MPGYDPQKNRRRPQAADTGAAPIDGLLGRGAEEHTPAATPAGAVPPLPSPMVTPPPPLPDPDARVVSVAAICGVVIALVAALWLRRWWRRR